MGYWPGLMGHWGMDQAITGRGGGLVVWLARRFRFWTVAVSRNSS